VTKRCDRNARRPQWRRLNSSRSKVILMKPALRFSNSTSCWGFVICIWFRPWQLQITKAPLPVLTRCLIKFSLLRSSSKTICFPEAAIVTNFWVPSKIS
jgi:hypothetical protein